MTICRILAHQRFDGNERTDELAKLGASINNNSTSINLPVPRATFSGYGYGYGQGSKKGSGQRSDKGSGYGSGYGSGKGSGQGSVYDEKVIFRVRDIKDRGIKCRKPHIDFRFMKPI